MGKLPPTSRNKTCILDGLKSKQIHAESEHLLNTEKLSLVSEPRSRDDNKWLTSWPNHKENEHFAYRFTVVSIHI